MMHKVLKHLLSLLFLISVSPFVLAQNVGVGTSTPAEKLHVAGTLRVDDLQTAVASGAITDKVVWTDANGKVYSLPVGLPGRMLGVNGSGFLAWLNPGLSNTLNDGQIWIGDASNTATPQTPSGDALISNTGVITIQDNAVDGTDITITGESNGSLMYFDGTNWVSLGIGTPGQVLTIVGGVPAWVTPAAAPVFGDLTSATSGVSITGGTGAVVGAGTSVNVATNALGQNGLVPGPTAANPLQVWGTDAAGVPAWRDPATLLTTRNVLAGAGNNAVSIASGANQVIGASDMTVSVATNALTQDGVVTGTTPANVNDVWGTDATGMPAWRDPNALLTKNDLTAGVANNAVSITNGSQQLIGGVNATINVATNGLNQAGVVTGTTAVNANQVWGTDAAGNPTWSDVNNLLVHENALTEVAPNIVRWGGTLMQNTTVTQGNFSTTFDMTGTGNFNVADGGGNALQVAAANGNTGLGNTTPDNSAVLDAGSVTNRGFRAPNVALSSTTDAVTISSPVTSLLVFNTATAGVAPNDVTPGYYYNAGTPALPNWVKFGTDGNDWKLLGNAGTSSLTNFIGTTDGVDFVTRTSNVERVRVLAGGNVGIGTASPFARLHVNTNGGMLGIAAEGNSTVGTWLSLGNTDPSGRWFQFISTSAGNGEGPGKLILTRGAGVGTTSGLFMTFDHASLRTGVNTTTPASRLDLNGDLALREGAAIAVAAGANALTLTGENSHYRLTGAAGAFNINTIANGNDGQLLTLINATGQTMTINNNNAANGILTGSGANLVSTNTGNNSVTLIYNATLARWVVQATTGMIDANDWHLTGNAGTSAATNFIGTTDNVDFVTRTSNAERMRVTGAGRVKIGANDPFKYGLSVLEVQGDGATPHISYASDYPSFIMMRHNGTNAAPTTLANGDNVGEIRWYGHNGTTYMQTARILSYIDGPVAAGSVPGDLRFMTNNVGANLTTEKMRINNTGQVGIGTLPSPVGTTYGFEKLKLSGDANINDVELEAIGAGGFGAILVFAKANGTYTTGTRTIVNNGDQIGNLQFNAYDGANYRAAAHIIVRVDGAPGANDIPSHMGFYTSPDGFAAPAERMRITNSGNVGIGTAAPDASALLQVASPSRGMLIPNVALTATNVAGPITLPATSLLVYNTATAGVAPNNVVPGYYYNAGTGAAPNWRRFAEGTTAWNVGGNQLTAGGIFGTLSNNFVDIYTNNVFRGRMSNVDGEFSWAATGSPYAGDALAATGTVAIPFGVNGYSAFNGSGTWGEVLAASTTGFSAVQGVYGGSGVGSGVFGNYAGTNTSITRAGATGYNSTVATGGAGVVGYHAAGSGNQHMGVLGYYNGAAFGIGVHGIGFGGGILAGNIDVAVVGWRANNQNYSGYFNGNHVIANGTKSASVPTTKGNQLLYVMESPEVWFEDFGTARLVNGVANVKLDDMFMETVLIDEAHPMHVFVQVNGECEDVYVIKGMDGFTVKEKNNGQSNVEFSYRIVAKRLHFPDHRFGNDPVWGPGDTRKYSQPAPKRPIDYDEMVKQDEEARRNWKPTPMPEGFQYLGTPDHKPGYETERPASSRRNVEPNPPSVPTSLPESIQKTGNDPVQPKEVPTVRPERTNK